MLNEYHKFSYKDKYFILNVEDMKAYRINKPLYDEIEKIEIKGKNKVIKDELEDALKKMNLLNNKKDKKNKSSKKIDNNKPVTHISLNVTQNCNLQCIYCYGDGGEYDGKGFMTFKTAKDSIDWLIIQSNGEKRLVVTFFGGEPLLNFRLIKKIVEYSRIKAKEYDKEILFTITTNGTLLDEEKQKYLIENNITAVLSIDGNLLALNKNRPWKDKKHNHKITIENVKNYLNKKDGKVTARATITKYNSNLSEVGNYLGELGFRNIYMTYAAIPNEKKIKYQTNVEVTLNDQLNIFEYLENLAENTISLLKKREEIIDKSILIYVKRLYQRGKRNFYCGVGRGLVGISKTGEIYPCHRFVGVKDFLMGNIQNVNSFNNGFYLNNRGIESEICNKCWVRYFCGGGCIYESLMESGSFNIPDEKWCMKLRKIIELSIYVYDNLNSSDKKYLGFRKIEDNNRKP